MGGEEVALGIVRPDGDNDLIEEVKTTSYDIRMTTSEGIEGPRIESFALHERGELYYFVRSMISSGAGVRHSTPVAVTR